jgi:hypothetical protein
MPQWTKQDVIRQAFSEIGMGAYEFDLQPEDMQTGLRKLDAMMATLGGAGGVRIGYAGGDGKGDLGADTLVPDWAYEALYLNLALRLCPDFGKTPSPTTMTLAKQALDAVRSRTVPVATRRIGGYAGAGNSWWGAMALPENGQAVATGPDNTLPFGVENDAGDL